MSILPPFYALALSCLQLHYKLSGRCLFNRKHVFNGLFIKPVNHPPGCRSQSFSHPLPYITDCALQFCQLVRYLLFGNMARISVGPKPSRSDAGSNPDKTKNQFEDLVVSASGTIPNYKHGTGHTATRNTFPGVT